MCRGECVEVFGNFPWKVSNSRSECTDLDGSPDPSCSLADDSTGKGSINESQFSALFFVLAGARPVDTGTPDSVNTFSISHTAQFTSLPEIRYKSPKYQCFEEFLGE